MMHTDIWIMDFFFFFLSIYLVFDMSLRIQAFGREIRVTVMVCLFVLFKESIAKEMPNDQDAANETNWSAVQTILELGSLEEIISSNCVFVVICIFFPPLPCISFLLRN
ncbi:uncharacterized protein BP01DRAFT_224280 [Aspergillus saccharolyticus JOP 1030-1]|uniref:Uncharacterized protein n=1 Tax=Aspergillus saccharolyticus JOP 1030-1 TaxID=1450539 RepID=A0A318YZ40_9EURO|nr:hypothetical protein BP01DRAFT_224280 [Aspergillus saccharolyticus JOP 1030-1]PYH40271.1 hypothetical protein BP01DRAFT_224280 [Aspergillus saccharolyticus JOP 1030-1]